MCKGWLYCPIPRSQHLLYPHVHISEECQPKDRTKGSSPAATQPQSSLTFRASPEMNHALGTSVSGVTTLGDTSWHRASAAVFGERFSGAAVCQQWNSLDQHHLHSRLGREGPDFQIRAVAHGRNSHTRYNNTETVPHTPLLHLLLLSASHLHLQQIGASLVFNSLTTFGIIELIG